MLVFGGLLSGLEKRRARQAGRWMSFMVVQPKFP
jgi:hypothetical protein